MTDQSSSRVSCGLGDDGSGRRELDQGISPWGEYTQAQLESLVLESIKALVEARIRKISSKGYNRKEAIASILHRQSFVNFMASNPSYESAKLYLRNGCGSDGGSDGGNEETGMELFQKRGLESMVRELRRGRESLPRADALWCLLVSDLNVAAAIKDLDSINIARGPSPTSKEAASREEPELIATMKVECFPESSVVLLEKDRIIEQLRDKMNDLERQLEERTEWARSKVLQAAQRLSKDFNELKMLRSEREEALRLSDIYEKERWKLQSSVDQLGVRIQEVDVENAELRADLEATRLSAAESAASNLEASKQEKKWSKASQSWERQRAKLQEELAVERRKFVKLQDQMAQAKESQNQAEARSRHAVKARDEALSRLEEQKLAGEKVEAAAKQRIERIERAQRKSDDDLQAHRDEIQKLENEVRKLKSGTPELSLMKLNEQELPWSIRRDRECVMCLCQEISVVFLPCAHQVVCVKCNEWHEKNGMAECPSCRTRIQQRVRVFNGAN